MKYRKRPVVIDAEEFWPDKEPWPEGVEHWGMTEEKYRIKTLEGWHIVTPGDFIITGVKGEKYPCKPDIFAATYDLENPAPQPLIATYLAMPLTPIDEYETRQENIGRAKTRYFELSKEHPDRLFLMPWLLNAELFDETPENRAMGMKRNFAAIDLCVDLWLDGPRISSGMQDEANYAYHAGKGVRSLVESVPIWRPRSRYA